MNIIHNFVLRYIKNHLCHERAKERNDIIDALVNGTAEEFCEDDIPTRYYFLIKLMLENDNDYNKHIKFMNTSHKITQMPTYIGGVAEEAADDVAKKLGYWEKH